MLFFAQSAASPKFSDFSTSQMGYVALLGVVHAALQSAPSRSASRGAGSTRGSTPERSVSVAAARSAVSLPRGAKVGALWGGPGGGPGPSSSVDGRGSGVLPHSALQ